MRTLASPTLFAVAAGVLLSGLATTVDAQTLWQGPSITFSKTAFSDATSVANQDVLTPSVAITRGETMGIYNAATEAFFSNGTSPADTLWATGFNNPGETIDVTNFANLTFEDWTTAYGGGGQLQSNITAFDAVVHLVSDDIYLNLRFDAWAGGGGGGAFTYTRSTAIPEPASLAMLGLAGVLSVTGRRRR